jgi:hypothetical protein
MRMVRNRFDSLNWSGSERDQTDQGRGVDGRMGWVRCLPWFAAKMIAMPPIIAAWLFVAFGKGEDKDMP